MTTRELLLVLGAFVRVLRDSNRIDDIHLVADITGRGRFERVLTELRRREEGRELLCDRPTLGSGDIDLEAMRALRPATLGGALARHLDAHRLELYDGPPSSVHLRDADVRYLVHRYRQLHDIWHVLLGLGTAGHEEVLVHAFTLGHLRLPNSALIVVFGGLEHMLFERRWQALRRDLWRAYERGRHASDLLTFPWPESWALPLDEVRRRVNVAAL